jgi:hypothetical protein
VLSVPQVGEVRDHDAGNGTQAPDYCSRLVEPRHMGVAGREVPVRVGEARILLVGEKKPWDCFVEAEHVKMRGADCEESPADVKYGFSPTGAGYGAAQCLMNRLFGIAGHLLKASVQCSLKPGSVEPLLTWISIPDNLSESVKPILLNHTNKLRPFSVSNIGIWIIKNNG